MTSVLFFKDNQGNYIGFSIEGHSGYASIGGDIVCSAISTISQATVHAVENVIMAPVEKISDEENAKLSMMVKCNDERLEWAELFLVTMHHVIEEISNQYPNHVSCELIEQGGTE